MVVIAALPLRSSISQCRWSGITTQARLWLKPLRSTKRRVSIRIAMFAASANNGSRPRGAVVNEYTLPDREYRP